MRSLDLLQRRDADTHADGEPQPRQDDRHRQAADRPRNNRSTVVQLMVAHESFSAQKVDALVSCAIRSALTAPSTTMRHPMTSLSPCATTFPTDVASVIAKVNDQGKRAWST